jgi:hypothetical protein
LRLSSAERWLTGLISALGTPVHLAGLLAPGLYRDPAVLLPQNHATDFITLFLGIPLLAGAGVAAARGSLRGRLLWLGALGFLVYDYGMYALGVRWNPLFLGYLALFGLSLFALILGLSGTDSSELNRKLGDQLPRKAIAAYLAGVAVAVGAAWLSEETLATFRGEIPPSVTEFETPTNIVHVFDLAIVLPAMAVAAVLLLRRRPWGALLSGVLLIKAATIGLWVLVMMGFMARAGYSTSGPQLVLFSLLTFLGALLSWRFLQQVPPSR